MVHQRSRSMMPKNFNLKGASTTVHEQGQVLVRGDQPTTKSLVNDAYPELHHVGVLQVGGGKFASR